MHRRMGIGAIQDRLYQGNSFIIWMHSLSTTLHLYQLHLCKFNQHMFPLAHLQQSPLNLLWFCSSWKKSTSVLLSENFLCFARNKYLMVWKFFNNLHALLRMMESHLQLNPSQLLSTNASLLPLSSMKLRSPSTPLLQHSRSTFCTCCQQQICWALNYFQGQRTIISYCCPYLRPKDYRWCVQASYESAVSDCFSWRAFIAFPRFAPASSRSGYPKAHCDKIVWTLSPQTLLASCHSCSMS